MGPLILITFAGLMVIFAGVWRHFLDNPEQQWRMWHPMNLEVFAGMFVIVAGVWNYSSAVDELDTTRGYITGGDSFVYLDYLSTLDSRLRLGFTIQQEGRFPVYDIQVDVFRADSQWNEIFFEGRDGRPHRQFSVPVMSEAHPPLALNERPITAWDYIPVPEPEAIRFKIILTTRNDYFLQFVRLDNQKTNWRANWVLLDGDDPAHLLASHGDAEEILASVGDIVGSTTRPSPPRPVNPAVLRRRRN